MFDKFFVGLNLTSVEDHGVQRPISRVTFLLDNENSVTAGDDTGAELLADCPHATQAIADAVLTQIKGYQYRMFNADDAALDPAAELGDGVTAGGVYSVISRLSDDGSGYSGVTAPGKSEMEDEYPAGGPLTQEFSRKIAQTNSRITKTAEHIRLEVSSKIGGLSSSIDVQLNSIAQKVENTEAGLSQTLRVAADGVTITNAQGSTLTIDGGQIDASKIHAEQLDASRIRAEDLTLTGAVSWGDLAYDAKNQVISAQNTAGNAQSAASSALSAANSAASTVAGWTYPGSTYMDGSMLMTGTVKATSLQGGSVSLLDYSGNPSGVMSITSAVTGAYAVDLSSYSALRISAQSGLLHLNGGPDITVGCANFYPLGKAANLGSPQGGMWNAVYSYTAEIITSDRSSKHDIEPVPDKYMDMLDRIEPVRFKVNNGTSGRYHMGFVAQEVEAAMASSGVDSLEFAGWCRDKGPDGAELQMLRYTEFIPLCVKKMRRLEARVAALEERARRQAGGKEEDADG